MNKKIIQAIIIGGAMGTYMFYGQSYAEQLGLYVGLSPSSYLYGTVGIIFVTLSTIFAKLVTRGLK